MELDPFEFDDAFMFMRYAGNILDGHGYTWNAGDPPVYGCTSVLYTWVIAAVMGITGLRDGQSQVIVGASLVFALVFLLQLYRGLRRHATDGRLRHPLAPALFTVPWLVLPLLFGFHVSSGMETTLSLLLNTVVIFAVMAYGRTGSWRHAGLAALFIWLAFLTRPDNALTGLLFPALYLTAIGRPRHFIRLALVAGLLLAADTAVKYAVFGQVLPLSFYAKRSGFTEGYTAKYFWNPVRYLTEITAYAMPYLLLWFALAARRHRLLLLAFLVPVLATWLYFFSFDQIMGFHARLYLPFVPFLIVPAWLLLNDTLAAGSLPVQKADTAVRRTVFLLVFLTVAVFSKYRFINLYESWAIATGNRDAVAVPGLNDRRYNREESIRHLDDLLKRFPDDFVLAATEHGFLSANNPGKRIVDLSGLHQPVIARSGYSDSLLAAERPDLVWMPHQDLTVLHQRIREGEFFLENYEYRTDVYAFGCALRKDSPYYESLKAALE